MSLPSVLLTSSAKNRAALRLAEKAHRGVTRKAAPDTPYILHPVSVATALASCGAGRNLVCGGCLHDVVEDSDITLDYIEQHFGGRVAALVGAVTKTREVKDAPLDRQAELVLSRLDDCRYGDEDLSEDAAALKAADLLANISDLVFDAEDHGLQSLVDTLGKGQNRERALAKINHYLQLGEALCQRLLSLRPGEDGRMRPGRYPDLAAALRSRMDELEQFATRL